MHTEEKKYVFLFAESASRHLIGYNERVKFENMTGNLIKTSSACFRGIDLNILGKKISLGIGHTITEKFELNN